jgi:hypothetical protein
MRNHYLDAGTAREIDALVDRVHRDLGHPQGPIELATVRDLLKLDLQDYSTEDSCRKSSTKCGSARNRY